MRTRNEAAFQDVYEAAGGAARLGNALGLTREVGPGWVQDLDGGPNGEPAVICALFDQPAVAVARTIWNEIAGIGAGSNRGATGVGYPVLEPSATGALIRSDDEVVTLAGGRWGLQHRGRLLRQPLRPPIWQPDVAFDCNASLHRDVWTGHSHPMDLRPPGSRPTPVFADEWRISSAGRSHMMTELAKHDVAEAVRALAERYALDPGPALWREISPPDGRNDSRCTAHEILIGAAGGRPAVKLCVRLTLPNVRYAALLAVVDLRVDYDAIRPGGTAQPAEIPTDLRITYAELTTFFANAWHVVTMIAPLAAVDDPIGAPPYRRPPVGVLHSE